jgi:DNA-binding NarL/FixJ family response regulator
MFVELLGRIFRSESDIQVVGTAGTASGALEAVAQDHPHVVLLDYHLPDAKGSQAAGEMIASNSPAVVFLSSDDSVEALLDAAAAGAVGYVSKTEAVQTVVDAVRRAASGEMMIPPHILAQALRRVRSAPSRAAVGEPPSLTAKEREVLRLLSEGMDNKSLARAAGVSVETAKWHVRNILEKLGARSRLEAVVIASRDQLLN